MKPHIALMVGHSRSIGTRKDGGAESWDGHENEWAFNEVLATKILALLLAKGIESTIYDSYAGSGYGAAMRWLAKETKADGITHGVELHFNSAGPNAHGHEVLYYAGSLKGQQLAIKVNNALTSHFNTPNRGAKGITRTDRGGEILYLTNYPMIISEPFFGSSKEDWEATAEKIDELAHAMAEGIEQGIAA